MKHTKTLILTLILIFAISVFAVAQEEKTEQKPNEDVKYQTICPVMEGEIDKDLYVDHDGKRVYLCCDACVEKFKEDPETYIKKLEDAGVTLEKAPKAQTICPIMGGEINKEIYADYKGKRVYFCCEACPDTFMKDPEKYIKQMEEKGIELETVGDAKCDGHKKKAHKHDENCNHETEEEHKKCPHYEEHHGKKSE